MQKNVPKYTPDLVPHGVGMGRGVEARGVVRAVQRPSHVVVVRQPARRGVPPDAWHSSPISTADAPRLRPRSTRGRRVRRRRRRRPSRSPGVGRRRPRRCGQDAAGRRGCTSSCRSPTGHRPRRPPLRRGRSPRRAELLDPDVATTAFVKADRGGKVFVDATRPAAPRSPRRTARASGPACRCRSPCRGTTSTGWCPASRRSARRSTGSGAAIPGPSLMPPPQALPADLVAEGAAIPVARVAAMHEGKRRARARRET